MGGRATKNKEVKKGTSTKSKTVPAKQPLKKKAELRSKSKEIKAEVKVSKPKKAPKFTYESLILDHRENGRKLARSILRKWRVHMPGEEVDSIVDLALCESAQRFCPKKGASFMTFFFYHLRGHLVRAVARATQSCAIINGPKSDEWCDEEHSEFASSYGAYLNNELHNQRENETPEQIILRREKILVTRDAIDKLDTLEKVVLDKSYGDDEALVDIAKNLGYSRCHISRVKKGALIRLKTVLEHSNAVNGTVVKKKEETISSSKNIVVKLERKTRRKNKRSGKIIVISSQAA